MDQAEGKVHWWIQYNLMGSLNLSIKDPQRANRTKTPFRDQYGIIEDLQLQLIIILVIHFLDIALTGQYQGT